MLRCVLLVIVVVIIGLPPDSTRTYTHYPYAALFRSAARSIEASDAFHAPARPVGLERGCTPLRPYPRTERRRCARLSGQAGAARRAPPAPPPPVIGRQRLRARSSHRLKKVDLDRAAPGRGGDIVDDVGERNGQD